MKPKEGAMTWTCGISLMSTVEGDKLDRAYDFIDAMLSPEAGAHEIREFGYGHANLKAYEIVSAEELAERGLTANPDDLLSSGIFQKPITNEPQLQAMFEEVKAGL
jgi:spermidine/putrescine transport system substrate-binding protein